jgi:predicted enzyme involved in methoxymalonyl-ACP biosynthesis
MPLLAIYPCTRSAHRPAIHLVATPQHSKDPTAARCRRNHNASKSSQFNLTTRRYNEPGIAALQSDPDALTIQARLETTE